MAIVYWLFVVGAARDRLLLISLSGITGGILGNLYDRLGLWCTPEWEAIGYPKHAVRDWILFASAVGHGRTSTWPTCCWWAAPDYWCAARLDDAEPGGEDAANDIRRRSNRRPKRVR